MKVRTVEQLEAIVNHVERWLRGEYADFPFWGARLSPLEFNRYIATDTETFGESHLGTVAIGPGAVDNTCSGWMRFYDLDGDLIATARCSSVEFSKSTAFIASSLLTAAQRDLSRRLLGSLHRHGQKSQGCVKM